MAIDGAQRVTEDHENAALMPFNDDQTRNARTLANRRDTPRTG